MQVLHSLPILVLTASLTSGGSSAQMDALRLSNVDSSVYGFVRVPDAPTLRPEHLTLEAWVMPLGNGYGNTTIDQYGADLIARADDVVPSGLFVASWAMRWSPVTHRINVNLDDGVQHGTFVFSNAVVPPNTPTHVAMTFDGSRIRLYVGGVLDSDVPWPYPIYYETEDVVWIGTGEGPNGFLRRFDGTLDSIRLWDHARSPSEIVAGMQCEWLPPQAGLLAAWNFDSGNAQDSSGHANHGTPNGPGVSFVPEPIVLDDCSDVTAPTISCPSLISTIDPKSGAPGETVTFSVTATDDHDPSPSLDCVPPSGSFFSRGTTMVTCTATDASGNQSICTFPVLVMPTVRERR